MDVALWCPGASVGDEIADGSVLPGPRDGSFKVVLGGGWARQLEAATRQGAAGADWRAKQTGREAASGGRAWPVGWARRCVVYADRDPEWIGA
jgi:hypothetical protein